jgi:hypothetical protein
MSNTTQPITITIKNYQKEYIDNHFVKLSVLVQSILDTIIQEEKNGVIEKALDDGVPNLHVTLNPRRKSKGVKA